MNKTQEQTNMVREHFTFFLSFREQIDLCTEADQLRLYRAITDLGLFGRDTHFEDPLLNMAWIGIRPILEKSWNRAFAGQTGGENGKGISRNIGNNHAAKSKAIGKDRIGMDRIGVKKETTTVAKKGDLSLSLPNRKEKFKNDLRQFTGMYAPNMLNDFFQYWTEPNKSGTKMRWELQQTWDTKRRLQRWSRNNFNK